MRFTRRGPSLDFRDDDEAEAFGHNLATAITLWEVHGGQVPSRLRAARDYLLNGTAGATRGRISTQVRVHRGPSEAALGPDRSHSDQPARLTVSVNEAAVLGEVHPRTVRKWITKGLVDASRGPRGALRVDLGSLQSRIEQRHREEDDEHEAA